MGFRKIERERRDSGAWGDTTALEGLLEFLGSALSEPALAAFRNPSAASSPAAVPESSAVAPLQESEGVPEGKPDSRSRMLVPIPSSPGSPSAPEPGSLVGRTIDHYHIQEKIGEGGMGTVYLAHDLTLDRQVALKILHDRFAKEPAFVDRFTREAKLAGKLSHPNLVTGYRAGDNDGFLWYVMEYVPSRTTLADHLEARGRMGLAETLRTGLEAAMGLHAIHSQGWVHRDIKPDNLMVIPGPDGAVAHVKILDAGLVRPVDDSKSITTDRLFVGTPEYASPEQLQEKSVDGRSDLYQLGVILYECLAGGKDARPYPAKSKTTFVLKTVDPEAVPIPLRDRNPEVPVEVAALVHKLLEKEPTKRPSSAAEVVSAIEDLFRALAHGPDSEILRPKTSRLLPAAAALVAVALTLAAVAFWSRTGITPKEGPVPFDVTRRAPAPLERPSAPENLAASALSSSEISLTWSPARGHDQYRVERSEDEGRTWQALPMSVPAGTERLTDGNLSMEKEYLYRVLGLNTAGPGPASNVARAEPLRIPLPDVRLPGPGDFPPSPPRESASSERWFLDHVPTSDELLLIRRGWEVLERRDPEIQSGSTAGALAELAGLKADPKATTYSSYVLGAEATRLAAASEVRAAFDLKLRVGAEVDLRLVDGRTVSGTLAARSPEALEVKAPDPGGQRARVDRKDIAEESVLLGAPETTELLFRATYGNPHGALTLLARRLAPPELEATPVQGLAALPGIVHGAAVRAGQALMTPDFDLAAQVLRDLDKLVALLPKNLEYALEARALVTYELSAARALEKGRTLEVLSKYDRSRSYARALRDVHAAFVQKASAESFDRALIESWKFVPFEQDPEERGRHVYRDDREKAWVIEEVQGFRKLSRTLEAARSGYRIETRFDPAPLAPLETSGWVLGLTDPSRDTRLEITGNRTSLALFELPRGVQEGKLLASRHYGTPEGFHRLSVVPLGELLLVFDEDELAFKVTLPAGTQLDPNLRIGVSGGSLRLRSVRVARSADE
jgi:serine/threonine-protein kinase